MDNVLVVILEALKKSSGNWTDFENEEFYTPLNNLKGRNIDSLALVETVMFIEEDLDIEVDDNLIEFMVTIDDIERIVRQLLREKNNG